MQAHKDTNEEDSAPTIEEVQMAIQKLKNYEAPGTDNIPAELFKYGGNESVKHLHTIIKDIWQKEKMLTGWNISIICPIHIKGHIMQFYVYWTVHHLDS